MARSLVLTVFFLPLALLAQQPTIEAQHCDSECQLTVKNEVETIVEKELYRLKDQEQARITLLSDMVTFLTTAFGIIGVAGLIIGAFSIFQIRKEFKDKVADIDSRFNRFVMEERSRKLNKAISGLLSPSSPVYFASITFLRLTDENEYPEAELTHLLDTTYAIRDGERLRDILQYLTTFKQAPVFEIVERLIKLPGNKPYQTVILQTALPFMASISIEKTLQMIHEISRNLSTIDYWSLISTTYNGFRENPEAVYALFNNQKLLSGLDPQFKHSLRDFAAGYRNKGGSGGGNMNLDLQSINSTLLFKDSPVDEIVNPSSM